MICVRNEGPDWAKKPDIERVMYLEFALAGNYQLAVQHAEKSMEEYLAISTLQKNEYFERINDLKAAKEYILSLKKKK